MTDNMPTLYRNVMDGLPEGIARDAFLWATERSWNDRLCYRAERFANEVHVICATIRPLIDTAQRVLADQRPELPPCPDRAADQMAFILTRHANSVYGGNVSPDWARRQI